MSCVEFKSAEVNFQTFKWTVKFLINETNSRLIVCGFKFTKLILTHLTKKRKDEKQLLPFHSGAHAAALASAIRIFAWSLYMCGPVRPVQMWWDVCKKERRKTKKNIYPKRILRVQHQTSSSSSLHSGADGGQTFFNIYLKGRILLRKKKSITANLNKNNEQ